MRYAKRLKTKNLKRWLLCVYRGFSHPLAAGFGIRSENVLAFREGVNEYVTSHAMVVDTREEIDAVLPWRDATLALGMELERSLLHPCSSGGGYRVNHSRDSNSKMEQPLTARVSLEPLRPSFGESA